MKYDPETNVFTIKGVPLSGVVVAMVMGDILEGQAVLVTPDDTEGQDPKSWIVFRQGTDGEGRPIIAKREFEDDEVVARARRTRAKWSRRTAPEARQPGCTYPICGCRPGADRKAVCEPPPPAQRSNAHELVPYCPLCQSEIMVAEPTRGGTTTHRAASFPARCMNPECGWLGMVSTLVETIQQEEREFVCARSQDDPDAALCGDPEPGRLTSDDSEADCPDCIEIGVRDLGWVRGPVN